MSALLKLLPFFILFLIPLAYAQDDLDSLQVMNVDEGSLYLPDYLNGIYIGMPLKDFKAIKDTSIPEIDAVDDSMYYEVTEDVNDEAIDSVFYKFDKEENGVNSEMPLYQVDLKFLQPDSEEEFCEKKFGETSKDYGQYDKEWIFTTGKDYVLIVKEKGSLVQIIATMPGTEWDPDR